MSAQQIQQITTDRLAKWAQRAIRNNATPMILINIGHGHNSGQISLCTVEDMDNRMLKALLQRVIEQL